MASKMTYGKMASMQVEKMTVRELKSYIREMAVRVARGTQSSMKAVASHARYVVSEFGTYRRNRKTYMRMGLSHARKSELIEKAQTLRSYAKTYSTNAQNRSKKNSRAHKAWRTFCENYGEIPFNDWEAMFEAGQEFARLAKKYGSDFVKLFMRFQEKGCSMRRFVDIFLQAERELVAEGIVLTKISVFDRAYELLKQEF